MLKAPSASFDESAILGVQPHRLDEHRAVESIVSEEAVGEDDAAKVAENEVRRAKIGTSEVASNEHRPFEPRAAKISAGQVDPNELAIQKELASQRSLLLGREDVFECVV